jgi:hypothetical protein
MGIQYICMHSRPTLEDELLEQVLEDERQAALDDFRQRDELTVDTAERAGQ